MSPDQVALKQFENRFESFCESLLAERYCGEREKIELPSSRRGFRVAMLCPEIIICKRLGIAGGRRKEGRGSFWSAKEEGAETHI
ncbi:unnamed protein product [Moneuplotes crassus]|uniref:Uncharacterized protein n=1 Tax=Euplotes crassus TaxID=5936 RepID=A0AAD1Y6T4_EUPCR|nr:unnamed protein product [Moneuplotes crassus]